MMGAIILAIAGWYSYDPSARRVYEYQPILVVRPTSATVSVEQGPNLAPVGDFPGVFSVSDKSTRLSLQEPNWPDTVVDVTEPRGMTTLRATPPRATLSLSIVNDSSHKLTVHELPKKTKLTVLQNQVRLQPGPHELLVESIGYLPKRLSVDLSPNERRDLTLELVALPTLPKPGPYFDPSLLPRISAPRYQIPPTLPPTYRPPAPSYPPSRVAPPIRRPVPRFTPIAPTAQPRPDDPVPRFTPIRG